MHNNESVTLANPVSEIAAQEQQVVVAIKSILLCNTILTYMSNNPNADLNIKCTSCP